MIFDLPYLFKNIFQNFFAVPLPCWPIVRWVLLGTLAAINCLNARTQMQIFRARNLGSRGALKIEGDRGGADTLNGGKDLTRDSGESCEL